MKKYNVQNYVRYKNDLEQALARNEKVKSESESFSRFSTKKSESVTCPNQKARREL